jgi:hypothetical protein
MATVEQGMWVSDLIGAHDRDDFVLEVRQVSPTSPVLDRGAVVCKLANGLMTLAGAEGTGVADVYGINVDYAVVPRPATEGLAPAGIARNGVFKAPNLTVNLGSDLKDYETRLREIGIFLEQLELWVNPQPPAP